MFKDKLILHTDASIKRTGDTTAYFGGYLSNLEGVILYSFFNKSVNPKGFSTGDITYVETLAINDGIDAAIEMGASELIVNTDSLNSVRRFQLYLFAPTKEFKKRKGHLHEHDILIKNIIEKTDLFFDDFEINHISRTKNFYSDFMAEYCRKRDNFLNAPHKTPSVINTYKCYIRDLQKNIVSDSTFDFTEELKDHLKRHNASKRSGPF